MYFSRRVEDAAQTASPSIAKLEIWSGASGPIQCQLLSERNRPKENCAPTNNKVIFPPSQSAHDFPKHVRICIRGPSAAPLKDLVCKTNGTWFVMRPRARNGANNRGSFFAADIDFESWRSLLRGGGVETSESSTIEAEEGILIGSGRRPKRWTRGGYC
jgi:hypothetical protein